MAANNTAADDASPNAAAAETDACDAAAAIEGSGGGARGEGGGGRGTWNAMERERERERTAHEQQQRDRAVACVLGGGASVHAMLGLPAAAKAAEVRHARRLACRLLHPDRSINHGLRGTPQYARIEAAFRKVASLDIAEEESARC